MLQPPAEAACDRPGFGYRAGVESSTKEIEMADQSMRITNLPESGSPERIAIELMRTIITQEKWDGFQTRKPILDLYSECLRATRGTRPST